MPGQPSVLTMGLSAATRVAGVIGDPVEHSLSPAIHNAAFRAANLDWVYVAFPVRAERGPEVVPGVRAMGIAGLSVTMPHKVAVAAGADRRTQVVERLGVANTLFWQGNALVADSTDGAGLLAALRAEHGWDPAGQRIVVLGAGGAARAAVVALADGGARSVVVVGRRSEAVAAAVTLAPGVARIGSVDAIGDADLVLQATPVGMAGVAPNPGDGRFPLGVDPTRLGPDQLAVDLIYAPPETEFLAAARRQGATTMNGLGMLVHQAGAQFRAWTGEEPPLPAMSDAAVVTLAVRAAGEKPGEA